ncbi:MAG: serine protease [Myxococcaceae bacterium]
MLTIRYRKIPAVKSWAGKSAFLLGNAAVLGALLSTTAVAPSDGTLASVGASSVGARATTGIQEGPAQRLQRELVANEVKRQLDALGVIDAPQLIRRAVPSLVELNAEDNLGKAHYGSATYLGQGYFVTVKHAVTELKEHGEGSEASRRQITKVTIRHQGRDLPARVLAVGDADVEVHPGDWAIVRVDAPVDLAPMGVDTHHIFELGEEVLRLGNDYSKGIIPTTGYIGRRLADGLVSALIDGHPGVSGGAVLDKKGNLIGIPIGRIQGDYRFSFILPLREEMFRKLPPEDLARLNIQ